MNFIIRSLVCIAALFVAQPRFWSELSQQAGEDDRAICGGRSDRRHRPPCRAEAFAKAGDSRSTSENVAGGGGNTGAAWSRMRRRDGYTILAVSTSFIVNPSMYDKVPYDPIKDFAPITLVAASPNVLFVNPHVPAKTVKELIDLVKTQSRKIQLRAAGDRLDAAPGG